MEVSVVSKRELKPPTIEKSYDPSTPARGVAGSSAGERKLRKLERELNKYGAVAFRCGVYMYYAAKQDDLWILKRNLNFFDGKEIATGGAVFDTYDELLNYVRKLKIDEVY